MEIVDSASIVDSFSFIQHYLAPVNSDLTDALVDSFFNSDNKSIVSSLLMVFVSELLFMT